MPESLIPELFLLLRVALAGVLAAVVGYERETAGQSAGLRTHMLVAMSAALFVGLGEMAVRNFPDPPVAPSAEMRYDPIRVIQAVVIGIGFLGGGIIFVNREHTRTIGLTTAASVWATSGIGIATGLGMYVAATGAALLFVFVLRVLGRLVADDR